MLLRSDAPFARDIKALGLDELDFRDLFIGSDLSSSVLQGMKVSNMMDRPAEVANTWDNNYPRNVPMVPSAPLLPTSQPIDLMKVCPLRLGFYSCLLIKLDAFVACSRL